MGARSSRQEAMTTGRISWRTSLPPHAVPNHPLQLTKKMPQLSSYACMPLKFSSFDYHIRRAKFESSYSEIILRLFFEKCYIFKISTEFPARVACVDPCRREIAARLTLTCALTQPHAHRKTIFALFWLIFSGLGFAWLEIWRWGYVLWDDACGRFDIL